MSDPDGLSEALNVVSCLEIALVLLIAAAVTAWAAWTPRPKQNDHEDEIPF